MKKGTAEIQRGQAITFRIPSDTPDHILKQLQRLKETERRNFSSTIAGFILEGVSNSLSKEKETINVPLPRRLSKEQRNWLKHSHSEALLGNVVYHLLADPVRATSILATLNSNAINIDEALYLQEDEDEDEHFEPEDEQIYQESEESSQDEMPITVPSNQNNFDDELAGFDLDKARQELAPTVEDNQDDEPEEEDMDDLLGDFLAKMNR